METKIIGGYPEKVVVKNVSGLNLNNERGSSSLILDISLWAYGLLLTTLAFVPFDLSINSTTSSKAKDALSKPLEASADMYEVAQARYQTTNQPALILNVSPFSATLPDYSTNSHYVSRHSTWAHDVSADGYASAVHFPSGFNPETLKSDASSWQKTTAPIATQIKELKSTSKKCILALDFSSFSMRLLGFTTNGYPRVVYDFPANEINNKISALFSFIESQGITIEEVIPIHSRHFLAVEDPVKQQAFIDNVTTMLNDAYHAHRAKMNVKTGK